MNKKDIIDSVFFPRKSYIKKDEQDILVPVSDIVKIGVRKFLINKNSPTIIYFHGNAELAQEYDSIARLYNDFGMNFIVSDYRGYGLSNGQPDMYNLQSDSIKIFDHIIFALGADDFNGKIIVMGRSLGSASACEIISKRIDKVDKCIIESGFGTEFPILELMNIKAEDITYSLSDGFENLSKLKKYKKPIYFIHSDMDHIIPISEANLMLKECSSIDKELFVVKNANHNNIINVIGDIYFKKIKEFVLNES